MNVYHFGDQGQPHNKINAYLEALEKWLGVKNIFHIIVAVAPNKERKM